MIKFTFAVLLTLCIIPRAINQKEIIDWSEKALSRFEILQSTPFDDFWKRASCTDSALNLVMAIKNCSFILRNRITKLLIYNLNYFLLYSQNNHWVDDFDWWGLLGTRAYEYLRVNNSLLARQYLDVAIVSWENMVKLGYDSSDRDHPVAHGCRNGDHQTKGVKNTVTNALLFLLSTQLYLITNDSKYSVLASVQEEWFNNWFAVNNYHYLRSLTRGRGLLIQERPLIFDTDYNITTHPDWEPEWIWSGDQGLLIAALLNLKSTHSRNNIIGRIKEGIRDALIGDDGIIREAPFNASYSGYYAPDYFLGRGIMIRYINIRDIFSILPTVLSLWKNRDRRNNQFTSNFTSSGSNYLYYKKFAQLLNTSDLIYEWNLTRIKVNQRDILAQAVGLDFLAAALREFKGYFF